MSICDHFFCFNLVEPVGQICDFVLQRLNFLRLFGLQHCIVAFAEGELPDILLCHPTIIHSWKRALLEGASGVFERDGKKPQENDEEQVKELHTKIGELAAANFFVTKAQTVDQQVRRKMIEPANANLPTGKQCKLCKLPSISRSSLYYQPKQISRRKE